MDPMTERRRSDEQILCYLRHLATLAFKNQFFREIYRIIAFELGSIATTRAAKA